MLYEEIIEEVKNGAKFTVNFQKRTCRVNGKVVVNDMQYDGSLGIYPSTEEEMISNIEQLYQEYKHSVPSERSESHRHYYFRALPEKELSDEDMMYGERREVARCRLELYVLFCIILSRLTWNPSWGSWFWCSEKDKDLIILRDWIEPNKGGA